MSFEAGIVIGFLGGVFFSFVLTHFLARKVGDAVYCALTKAKNEIKEEDSEDPANWWKKGRKEEDS